MVFWAVSYGTNEDSFRNEIEMVSLNYRIGSASDDPPTFDNNQHDAMSEQELKSDTGNWSYFRSDSTLNRSLRIGDNSRVCEAEPKKVQHVSNYWDNNGLNGLHGFSIADFRNQIAGTLQGDLNDRSAPPPRHPFNIASQSSSNENTDDFILDTKSLPRSTPKQSQNNVFSSNDLCHCYHCCHVYGLGYDKEYARLKYLRRHNHLDSGYSLKNFGTSSSEEYLKIFELSDKVGSIFDLSCDKEGSRFIQEKLETASIKEKIMVFKEIVPHAYELLDDLYGNYVIQKILEHGMRTQRRELASMLYGHVLILSKTVYGCRVIQKAIEVADMDQKIMMIQELDGYIIECVHDQNGNHVIQKCIQCIPEKHIQFIIESFFDQLAFLSTQIYGCRVIQRVLGHCKNPRTQSKFMEEILDSVSMLAQDQYGNYVVQHVIENGKPHERSAVIRKLAGEIVELSRQKYASNVVEKCLCYGNARERENLVNEMLLYTKDDDPLQVMMTDPFANYVVQKALEVCNDEQMKEIVSRCLASSNVLKRYSYGKHIVSRVEKLIATEGFWWVQKGNAEGLQHCDSRA